MKRQPNGKPQEVRDPRVPPIVLEEPRESDRE